MIAGLPPELNNSFSWGLACAALNPGLRSILVYNCKPTELQMAASRLSQMLREVESREVILIQLASNETEDDLWGTLSFYKKSKAPSFAWQPGRLASTNQDQRIRLVVIPDLARLSLSSVRACVSLMGAEVAYLQRNGQDIMWAPNYCWLAACAGTDISQVSPHLLDRFSIRLSRPRNTSSDRAGDILSWLTTPRPVNHYETIVLSHAVRKYLHEVGDYRPRLDDEVITHVLKYFAAATHPGTRREIALARLATAHAQLVKANLVTKDHVDTAAAFIGLKLDNSRRRYLRLKSSSTVAQAESAQEEISSLSASASMSEEANSLEGTLIYPSDTQEILPFTSLSSPYLEDSIPTVHDTSTPRLKPLGYRAYAVSNGPIIATDRATSMNDVALISTLLEAAKFQVVRHKLANRGILNNSLKKLNLQYRKDISIGNEHRSYQFILSVSDLRTYRRAPVSKQLLVLLLDYTCLRDCLWIEAIIPHLEWAYTERAEICLIQVGAATTNDRLALRAQQVVSPSILARNIRQAFGVEPGQSTPLAHGLDLAARTLRKVLQNDRRIARLARLVVLSDGRGNVPLKASQTGIMEWPVNCEGIEDALQVAYSIREMKNTEIFLLNSQPQQYSNLPFVLAEALGALLVSISLSDKDIEGNG